MRISGKLKLAEYVQKQPRAARPLNKWVKEVEKATWETPNDLKRTFPHADNVGNSHYVFNIGGNNFRLIAVVLFIDGILSIRFIGSHADYDKIKDCSKI